MMKSATTASKFPELLGTGASVNFVLFLASHPIVYEYNYTSYVARLFTLIFRSVYCMR